MSTSTLSPDLTVIRDAARMLHRSARALERITSRGLVPGDIANQQDLEMAAACALAALARVKSFYE